MQRRDLSYSPQRCAQLRNQSPKKFPHFFLAFPFFLFFSDIYIFKDKISYFGGASEQEIPFFFLLGKEMRTPTFRAGK